MSPGLGHALQRNWNAPPRCSDQPATESGKGPRRLPGCWEGSLDAAPEVGFPERRLVYRWRRVITPENVMCPSVVPDGRDIEMAPHTPPARIHRCRSGALLHFARRFWLASMGPPTAERPYRPTLA